MTKRALFLALVLASPLLGCVGPDALRPGPTASLPLRPFAFGPPTVGKAACVDCYEPAIAVDPEGRMFLAANHLGGVGVSLDGGATFAVRPAPAPPGPLDGTGKPGGASDDVVQVAPWGTLFYTELWSDGGGVLGAGVHVASSDDAGEHWKTNTLVLTRTQPGSRALITDRQWLAFEEDGTIHLFTNGLLSQLIYDYVSHDGGRTFADPVVVATPVEHDYPSPEGLPFVSPDGYIVVPYWLRLKTDGTTGARGVGVSSSRDHGATWTASIVYVHAGNEGSAGGAWPAATVYPGNGTWAAAWDTTDDRILLSFSTDRGASWSPPHTIPKAVNGGVSGHPAVHARADGVLDVVYFSGAATRALRLWPDGRLETALVAEKAGGNSDYPYFDHTPDGRIATGLLTPQCSSNVSTECTLLVARSTG